MAKFRARQGVYFITSGKWITPAQVLRTAGKDVVLVYEQYGNQAAVRLNESRVYATEKEAKDAIREREELDGKLKTRYHDDGKP